MMLVVGRRWDETISAAGIGVTSISFWAVPPSIWVAVNNTRAELGHEGIRACRIRIVLLAILAGHGRTTEAEKDCSGDYAERFHC